MSGHGIYGLYIYFTFLALIMITSQHLPQNSLTGLRGSIGHCLDQSEFTKMGRSLAVVIYAVEPLNGNDLLSSLGRLMVSLK